MNEFALISRLAHMCLVACRSGYGLGCYSKRQGYPPVWEWKYRRNKRLANPRLGPAFGIPVFALDIGKGLVPVRRFWP